MTNREKYAEDILDLVLSGKAIAIVGNKPCSCSETPCARCSLRENNVSCLRNNCREKLKEWANAEYEKPEIDWSKVPVDTKIYVRNNKRTPWLKRYFAFYKNGIIYSWVDGAASWTTEDACFWVYAKLAEDEEQ